MPQSLAQIYVHLIFSTKNREPLINDDIRPRLHQYMAGILRDLVAPSLVINSEPDHAHVLFVMSRTISLSDTIGELKRGSSIWIKEIDPNLSTFHWQNGFGAFSVSASKLEVVRRYIQNQREHHRNESSRMNSGDGSRNMTSPTMNVTYGIDPGRRSGDSHMSSTCPLGSDEYIAPQGY